MEKNGCWAGGGGYRPNNEQETQSIAQMSIMMVPLLPPRWPELCTLSPAPARSACLPLKLSQRLAYSSTRTSARMTMVSPAR